VNQTSFVTNGNGKALARRMQYLHLITGRTRGQCWRQGWETFSPRGPETLLLAGGAIKELGIPVLVLNSILCIVCGATQQQGSHT